MSNCFVFRNKTAEDSFLNAIVSIKDYKLFYVKYQGNKYTSRVCVLTAVYLIAVAMCKTASFTVERDNCVRSSTCI